MRWLDRLPHQPPMRLLDAVVDVTPGESAVGRRHTVATDFFFQGHFPGQPVVPAIVLIEMVAQAGGIAAASGMNAEAAVPMRVAATGPFKFPAGAEAGAVLEVKARVAGRMGRLIKIEGDVTADGVLVASGSVTLAG